MRRVALATPVVFSGQQLGLDLRTRQREPLDQRERERERVLVEGFCLSQAIDSP